MTPQNVKHERVRDFDGDSTADTMDLEAPQQIGLGVAYDLLPNKLIERQRESDPPGLRENGLQLFRSPGGKGFRAVFNANLQGETGKEIQALMKKTADGSISDQEKQRSEELRQTLPDIYMNAELEEMFSITDLPTPAPHPARVLQSLACERCGEMTMESRTRRLDGKIFCIPCFAEVDQKSEGFS